MYFVLGLKKFSGGTPLNEGVTGFLKFCSFKKTDGQKQVKNQQGRNIPPAVGIFTMP
jgi:hypothetical protein